MHNHNLSEYFGYKYPLINYAYSDPSSMLSETIYYFNISGVIFHDENSEIEIAFKAAVHSVNVNERNLELEPIILRIPKDNPFKAEKAGKNISL